MAGLVGIAFTSPAIAVTVIDHDLFRVHFYRKNPGALHAFLQEADDRLPIVLLSSMRDLKRVEKVKGVHAFLLAEDPRALFEVKGANILDAVPDEKHLGYKKMDITPEDINSALSLPPSFEITEEALAALGSLADDISFYELVHGVTEGYKGLPDEYETNICMYVVRALQRRSWVARVQKPGLKAGVPVEKMAEIEKYIDTSPFSDLLWRAYYDHVENKVPLEEVVSQYEANKKDLEYVIKVLGESELKYCKLPEDSPIVFKKRRKVRKLKPIAPHGTSVSPLARKSPRKKKNPNSSVLGALLSSLDESLAGKEKFDHCFSRTACAFLVGLLSGDAFSEASRLAVKQGAKKATVVDLVKFVRSAQDSSNTQSAYCYYTYSVGVTASSAAEKYGVSPVVLKTILKYKPLALVSPSKTTFLQWPDGLEPWSM